MTLLSIPLVVNVIFNLFLLPVFFSLVLDYQLAMDKFRGLGLSPFIILHFQTGEGGSAKKKFKGFGVLVFNTVKSLMNILCNEISMPLFAGFGSLVLV